MGIARDQPLTIDDAQIEARIVQCLAERDAQASCCPSEIARALVPGGAERWRAFMPQVRAVAAKLAQSGRLCITRGTHIISDGDFSGGPVRLRRGTQF